MSALESAAQSASSLPSMLLPGHIAIIMDGNGRWAKRHQLPRLLGHQQGVQALRKIVQACIERGIAALTVFAFSSENWGRPQAEVNGLLQLFAKALDKEVPPLQNNGVRLYFAGDTSSFSPQLQKSLTHAQDLTQTGQNLTLTVCINYGGRWDMVQAAQKTVAQGLPLTEEHLSPYLALSHVGDPDLLIRTGGEARLSNFLLWQSAYSELFLSPLLWPDFDASALDQALLAYAARERRFGKISEQIQVSSQPPADLATSTQKPESHA